MGAPVSTLKYYYDIVKVYHKTFIWWSTQPKTCLKRSSSYVKSSVDRCKWAINTGKLLNTHHHIHLCHTTYHIYPIMHCCEACPIHQCSVMTNSIENVLQVIIMLSFVWSRKWTMAGFALHYKFHFFIFSNSFGILHFIHILRILIKRNGWWDCALYCVIWTHIHVFSALRCMPLTKPTLWTAKFKGSLQICT